ncbi:LysR family transcriptional regulator [Teredinibacter turnerae]|uniref:LysR family transcriptional regulator n=1 Tax=Teredinibacter turnerae TaxID=2426 RepID=UPI001F07F573|nr:LysR family transcriptional regulator [Teredinibacter turnerae]
MRDLDKLEAMRIFKRTAELLSFTAAAEDLGMAKARVSAAVQQLEDDLGSRLFHRTTRRVQLSPDGAEFLRGCSAIMDDLDALEGQLRGDTEVSGNIRVDMNVSVAKNLIIPRLPEFLACYPRVTVELSSVDYFVDPVKEGFDLVLRVGELQDSTLVARYLGDMQFMNCASRGYLEKYGEPQSPEDMHNHRVVDYCANSVAGTRSAAWEYWDGRQFLEMRVPYSIRVNNVEAYRAACLAGLGIAQMPRVSLHRDAANEQLVEILHAYSAGALPVHLLYPNRRNMPRKVRVFMDWLAEQIQAYLELK